MRFGSIIVIMGMAMLCSIWPVQGAEPRTAVDDNFTELVVHPVEGAYWWTRNLGDNAIFEDLLCAEDSCLSLQTDGPVTFADFALFPDAEPGDYTNVELAEYPTGYAYGEDGLWLPEMGHPVTLETRLRFVGDFDQAGSGSAVGTAGIGLWNSPVVYPCAEYPTGQFNPQTLLGFSWAANGNSIASGLAAAVVYKSLPLGTLKPAFTVDMTEWMTVKMVWRAHISGGQSVSFWLDQRYLGTVDLSAALAQPLTLVIWHDNQSFTFFATTYQNPLEPQRFQVDYVRIEQS